jgi:PAS domain S-box-containing protein
VSETKILIVEDEAIVARDAQDMLESAGYTVPAIALSGQEAIQQVAETEPDLVLMDVKLEGDLDGVEVAEEIHTRFDVPVVYLTAYADDETLRRAKLTGPFGYVVKPFGERELCSTVEMALCRHRMERKLRQRTAQLEALHDISLAITAQLELDELLQEVVEQGRRLLDAGGAGLYLVDEAQGDLELLVSRGYTEDRAGTRLAPGEGIAGKVLESGESMRVDDYTRWEGRSPGWEEEGITGALSVPLKRGGRVVGTLGFEAIGDQRTFDEQDVWLATLFANQAAIAIGNARLYEERARQEEELRDQERFLTLLNDVTRAALEMPDLQDMLQTLADRLGDLFGANGCYLTFWDEEAETVKPMAAYGEWRGRYQSVSAEPGEETMTASVLRAGSTLPIEDVHDTPHLSERIAEMFPTRSVLALPLIANDEKLGAALVAFEEPHSFTPEEIARGEQAADQIALAVAKAKLVEELRESEEALQDSKQRLELALHGGDLGTWDWNIETDEVHFNDRWATLVGGTPDEIEPHLSTWDNLVHPDDLPHAYKRLNAHLEGKTPSYEAEYRMRHKSGQWLWILDRGKVIERDAEGRPLRACGTHMDITERKEMEEQLRQHERLAALGQLAGGVAHDFNNRLASIVLYAQMGLRRPNLPPTLQNGLETILEESQRAADLVQQILDFARSAMLNTQPLSLVALVQERMALLRRTLPESIRLVTEMTSHPCTVQADPDRIHQALMNLALNARDAMPEGGELRIGVERAAVAPDEAAPLPDMVPGAYARLTVADTGTGMSEEAQEHLFEPFFTTKEVDKGTGLGLAQVHGIVKQHEGFIDVDTAVGEGTTFTIFLPLVEDEDEREAAESQDASPRSGVTILVIEDAEQLRRAIQAGLESLGYQVITVAHGREALETAPLEDVDLVLTDVVMPEMGGAALLRELQARAPHLSVIAMTGHIMDTRELLAAGFADVLLKPFAIEDLRHVVRGLLD